MCDTVTAHPLMTFPYHLDDGDDDGDDDDDDDVDIMMIHAKYLRATHSQECGSRL